MFVQILAWERGADYDTKTKDFTWCSDPSLKEKIEVIVKKLLPVIDAIENIQDPACGFGIEINDGHGSGKPCVKLFVTPK